MERMEDLPLKKMTAQEWKEAEAQAVRAARTRNVRPTAKACKPNTMQHKATIARSKATMKQTRVEARPKKALPAYRMPGEEQPRDSFGRFARKTGAVLWAGAKATGRAVAGTVKGVRKAHKTVKRVQASARKRANLEARERRIALAEREKKLGIRKKVTRRRKR